MTKIYKIELLGCLLVTLGLQKGALGAHLGDPGAPKWCLGCPWGGQNGVLGAPGAPLGHPWVTLDDPGVTMVGKKYANSTDIVLFAMIYKGGCFFQ